MANYLKGIGDSALRINEIMPGLDARINHFFCGHTAGIIKGEYNEFDATIIDRGVRIKSGLCQAYGYFGVSDTDTQINFIMPSGVRYLHIYAEIDLSVVPNRFEIKATPQSSSSAWTARRDNLFQLVSGKYQLHLWQVTLTASTILLSDRRSIIEKPKDSVFSESASDAKGLDGASVQRNGGVFNFTSGGDNLGKMVCIPNNAKLECKIPLLTQEQRFEKGHMNITIPNWSADKTYEWNYVLIGNKPSGEIKRVRGGEFTLTMCASGNSITLFVYGGPAFYDGIVWDNKGNSTDFGGEEVVIKQIYEIKELG